MDIKTLLLMLALGNLSLGATLYFFDAAERAPSARLPSAGLSSSPWSLTRFTLSYWNAARLCQAAAWLLLYLRGALPELLTIPLANGLLFAGLALDSAALWQLAGRRVWRRWLMPAAGASSLVFFIAWLAGMASGWRAALASLIVAGFCASGAAALAFPWRGASPLRRYLATTLGVLALALLVRGVLSLPSAASNPELVRALGAVALYLVMLTNAAGFLLRGREQLQEQMARLEVVDALTDVPNRRGFYQALTPWMALARRPGMPTALIVLNLDHFKRVNDNYGHPVGDSVLKTMVEVCHKQLRDSDLMGRLGGAEFAVQLPRTSLDDAMMVAERIRAAVASLPVKTERAVINLTASLGVTTIRAEDSTVSLFKRADEALQQAKGEGRNRVVAAPAAGTLDPL